MAMKKFKLVLLGAGIKNDFINNVNKFILIVNLFHVILGRVGKTSILLRYINGEWNDKQISTIQASFLEKKIIIDNLVILIIL